MVEMIGCGYTIGISAPDEDGFKLAYAFDNLNGEYLVHEYCSAEDDEDFLFDSLMDRVREETGDYSDKFVKIDENNGVISDEDVEESNI